MDENEKNSVPVEEIPDETMVNENSENQVPLTHNEQTEDELLSSIMGDNIPPKVDPNAEERASELMLSDSDSADAAEQAETDFLNNVQSENPESEEEGAGDAGGVRDERAESENAQEQVEEARIRNRRNRDQYRKNMARDEVIRQQRAKRAAIWSDLLHAQRRRSIVYGEIIGCKILPGSSELLAVILFAGTYRVMVPFSEVYVDFPIRTNVDTSTEAGITDFVGRQRAMLEKMYGLQTPFLVTQIQTGDDGSYVIVGSRAKAIKRLAMENFTPDAAGNAVMEIGDIVLATITTIAEHTIMLNVGGIDTRVTTRNLTYRYLPNSFELAKHYRVGQEIPVMITDVVKNETGNFTCLVSGCRAELEDAKNRHELFSAVGDMTYATISNVFPRKDGNGVIVLLYIDSYDLPAMASNVSANPLGRYPLPGDRVRVSYRDYSEETGMTFVGIRGNHGTIKP